MSAGAAARSLLAIVAIVLLPAALPLRVAAQGDAPAAGAPDPRTESQRRNQERRLAPGSQFRDELLDGSYGPDMVVVPRGRFRMGSPERERGRLAKEGPVHEVEVRAFALGRAEITRAQFEKFLEATGYRTDAEREPTAATEDAIAGCFAWSADLTSGWIDGTSWRNPGFEQGPDHPVACVSWNDATAYVEWLRRETGIRYRLPSEAEQEYTIRAGSLSTWPWGEDPDGGCRYANGADESAEAGIGFMISFMFASSDCDDGFVFTAPVAQLQPNAFRLHDTVGNVSEWSQDCYARTYDGVPSDGSAFEASGCPSRTLRGMSWSDEPVWLRSAIRLAMRPNYRYHNVGLRVARDI